MPDSNGRYHAYPASKLSVDKPRPAARCRLRTEEKKSNSAYIQRLDLQKLPPSQLSETSTSDQHTRKQNAHGIAAVGLSRRPLPATRELVASRVEKRRPTSVCYFHVSNTYIGKQTQTRPNLPTMNLARLPQSCWA